MFDGKLVKAKVEKGYNLLETSHYLKLHINGKPLVGGLVITLTINAITKAYYKGRDIEYYKNAKL